jgi:adenosine deaminase
MSFLRHLSEKDAYATLEEALDYKDIIVGVGLDSSEVGNPPSKFKGVFAKAREEGFITVAHAGEEGPAEYIREALELLNVFRIDHGNATLKDDELAVSLAESEVHLTMCPLSNLALQVVSDLKEHPLKEMLNKGLKVTINSDDPAYFGGYINENYHATAQALNLSRADLCQLAKNSITGSLLTNDEKELHTTAIDAYYERHA